MRTVMLTLIALVLAAPAALAQPQDASKDPNVVVTNGDAVVRQAPDRAFITISVEARAKSPRDAQRQNAEAMTAVQQRLATARIPKDAIRTLGYDLEQEFDFIQGRRIPREYVARNSIEVRVDDIARVGELLDVAVQGGATSIGGVRFDLQDRVKVELEALRLAVVDARGRAEAIVAGAGRAIDRIIKIEESREAGLQPMPRAMMAMKANDAVATTPVEPGLIEIRARVTLTASMR
jgi:uncharacterized protein YggE